MFDESLNCITNHKQLDVHTRLWAGRQVGSRYVGSEFMGHAAASDVLVHIHSAIKGFQLHKITTSVHGRTECQLEIPGAISE